MTGGVIHILGGHDGSTFTAKHYLYDIKSDSYTKLPDMPTRRNWGTIFLYKNKIYVIGGYTSGGATNVNEVYDRETMTWETKTPMPAPRWGATREHPVINGICYITHGQYPRATYPLTNFAYDPATDTWEIKRSPTYGRDGVANAVLNGKLHVIGGRSNHTGLTYHEVYDPETDSWVTKAPLPLGRADATAVVINGKIYLFGGYDESIPYDNTFEYDPLTDSWSEKDPMPTARWGLSAATDGKKAYVFGGMATGGVTDVLEIFDPSKPSGEQWTTGANLPYSAQGLMVILVSEEAQPAEEITTPTNLITSFLAGTISLAVIYDVAKETYKKLKAR